MSFQGQRQLMLLYFNHSLTTFFFMFIRSFRSVTDPRNGKRVALKKMPNVFQSLTSSKRAYRELKMLCFFKHNNVSSRFSPCFVVKLPLEFIVSRSSRWTPPSFDSPSVYINEFRLPLKSICLHFRFFQLWILCTPAT